MKLMTKEIERKLIKNHRSPKEKRLELKPVVKFFCPWGAATWLVSEYDPENRLFFGLCDLGQGVEIGYIDRDELEAIKGPFGLKIERDLWWTPKATMSEYMAEFTRTDNLGRIWV